MTSSRERGMATAEYTVGTLGAVFLAALLFKFALTDTWLFDQLRDIIERALRPGVLFDVFRHVTRVGR